MTSEVAVINRSAIALAADSAVTVETIDSTGRRTEKIFNTANKLFTLSKYDPVGIMVYNTMDLGGVPWETIIKEYRQVLGDKSFDTLKEYKDDFFSFLHGNLVLFPNEQEKDVISIILVRLFMGLIEDIHSNKEARTVFNKKIENLEKQDYAIGFEDDSIAIIINKYKDIIDTVASHAFKVSHIKNLKTPIRRFAVLALTKASLLEAYSGIVIAGFGGKEHYPKLYEYYVDAVVNGRVKSTYKRHHEASYFERGKVIGFAVDDIIETILRGRNPSYYYDMLTQAIELFTQLPNEIIDKIGELTDEQKLAYKSDAQTSAVQSIGDFFKKMDERGKTNHTFQIERAIAVMPFSELATVAEVFINLTQIRQRMSPDAETVGGPIDVAVISKADGFIWVKRKHYFKRELNHAYFEKYFRDG